MLATAGLAGAGAAAAAWPLIDQMNPDAQTLARAGAFDVDLAALEPGQQIVVQWRQQPVFVVRRTAEALKRLRDPELLGRLRDPDSQAFQQPAYAANATRSLDEEFLVVVGVCTHLGCIPEFHPKVGSLHNAPDWPGGYFCPCHGSKYDLAGRVFTGVPAPYNLPVPPHHYVRDKVLRVGENPAGQTFDFNDILQV